MFAMAMVTTWRNRMDGDGGKVGGVGNVEIPSFKVVVVGIGVRYAERLSDADLRCGAAA